MNVPALSLDFTSGNFDPAISFSRSGNTATVINSLGFIASSSQNSPRINYDPVTKACKGLLIEELRTNVIQYSNDFSQWTANTNATIVSGASTGPDNTSSMSKMVESSANAFQRISIFAGPLTTATAYRFSVFAKKAERDYLQLFVGGQFSQNYANFNLSNGTISLQSSANATIEDFGNGIYRCSIEFSPANAGPDAVYITAQTSGTATRAQAYQGDGSSGLYVYGAQLEQGSGLTSYIPTSGVSSTRNPDVATITGSNFTSFWKAAQGGANAYVTPSVVSGIRPLIQFDDGTTNEIIALRGNTTNPELYIVDGGAPQAQLDAGTIAANTAYSLTGWWATNDCKARKDSGAVVTDTAVTIPTVTQMRIGSDGTNYLNGTIATISYYDSFFGQSIYTRRKNKVFSSLF
jgi:hypothetical protein